MTYDEEFIGKYEVFVPVPTITSTSDGVFTRHETTYADGKNQAFVYYPETSADNDLLARHEKIVSQIREWVIPEFAYFFPTLLDSGVFKSGTKWIAVEYELNEGWYSLSEVANEYPKTLSGRNVTWIFKRLLAAIGNAHDVGAIHGAISLETVFIHPEQHGLVLDGWGYSVDQGDPLVAGAEACLDVYPDDVNRGKPAPLQLDTILAAETMLLLLDRKEELLYEYFRGLRKAPPSDADYVHPSFLVARLNSVALEAYGAPEFSVLDMPNPH